MTGQRSDLARITLSVLFIGGLLAILIVPLAVALEAILTHTDEFAALLQRLPAAQLPAAPEWVGKLPLVGERVQAAWSGLASEGVADLLAQAQPYARAAAE
jgi:hypothetical protein